MSIELTTFVSVTILVICGVLGYSLKHITWFDEIANEYIPLALMVIGIILSIVAAKISNAPIDLNTIAIGMVSGVASTGVHQLVTKLIDKISNGDVK